MEITFLGQAGLFIETRHGTILCDPFFNPAYFASWFPFPTNEALDISRLERPDYLYISHIHRDHFDTQFLREHIWKEATVLLPDFRLKDLEHELREIGFTKFIQTSHSKPIEVGGLRFMIVPVIVPSQDPVGDSGLMVDDGETRIFDQNDSHPYDLAALTRHGPFDAHFLQYSGATWYPCIYDFPEKMMQVVGAKKRENSMIRALRYAQEIGAAHVFPSAGPPCFLDDALFHFNDFDRDPANPFPDQMAFLDYMQAHGQENGHLIIPGSVATFEHGHCTVTQPLPDAEIQAIFGDKRAYLEAYKARQQPTIDAAKARWPRGEVDIVTSLRDWFEPLLARADMICVGVNGRVVLDCGDPQIVIDFQQRQVYPWTGQDWDYRFCTDRALVEACILRHEVDWTNLLFLSLRLTATRRGPFNEFMINFFNSLSAERIDFVESYYKDKAPISHTWEVAGYQVQRYCPHQKADLARFGRVENGILTCAIHGWEFELATGRCLTSDDRRLYARPITSEQPATEYTLETLDTQEPTAQPTVDSRQPEHASATKTTTLPPQCKDCVWLPPAWRQAPTVATNTSSSAVVESETAPITTSKTASRRNGS